MIWCRLVKLAARAFYDDLTSKGENQPKSGRSDNRGIAVVILDALTRFDLTGNIYDFQFLIVEHFMTKNRMKMNMGLK